jgi:hypothetical protein
MTANTGLQWAPAPSQSDTAGRPGHAKRRPPTRRVPGRAVAWLPTHDPYFRLAAVLRTARALPPLYVTQNALLEVDEHICSRPYPFPFGLLTGALCVCPKTRVEYVLIDGAIRAESTLEDDDVEAQIAWEFQALESEARPRGRVVVGWYQGDAEVTGRVSPEEVKLHRALFPEPWQVMLVRSGASGPARGAFIRVDSTSARGYATPFSELVEKPRRRKEPLPATVVAWENYRAEEPVVHIAASATRSAGGGRRPWLDALREGLGLRPTRGTAVATPRVSPTAAPPTHHSPPGAPNAVPPAAARPAATGSAPPPDPPPARRPEQVVVAFPLLVADDEPVEATGGIGARLWIVALVVLAAAAVAASAWFRAVGLRSGT